MLRSTNVLDIARLARPRICAARHRTSLSTAPLPSTDASPHTDPPQLPRWVRRQSLHKGKAKEFPKSEFRSRHWNSDSLGNAGGKKEGLRLLEPHVLSKRLKKLCDRGKLDEAVSLLKNSPLDAQNTPVWNTLIWEAMKAKRYNLAYSLYTDMKRRGHSPTTRTFLTMLSGMSRIEDFSRHTKQLQNARSLYAAYIRHMKSVQRIDFNDPELSVDPLAPYIKILADAKCYNEIFDIFYSLESEGPLSPNHLIFTAMFQALASRPDTEMPTFRQTDVQQLWSQVIKVSKRTSSFIIDSHLATAAIAALMRGHTSGHDLAFQITRDFFGLSPPGTSRVPGILPLSSYPLATILRLCNVSRNYDLCIDFFNQVKRRSETVGGVSILDRLHLEEVLYAQQSLAVPTSAYQSLQTLEWMLRQELTGSNGGKIRPELSTFNTVLTTCWRSADWNSATRTFDLMTGYHSHDFMDGAVAEVPRFDQRAKGRNIVPTAESISSLVRTAHATRNRAYMRQCLRIVDHLGIDILLSRTTTEPDKSRRTLKNRGFYVTKLAQAVVEVVECLLPGSGPAERNHSHHQDLWKGLAARAKMELQEASQESLIPTLHKSLPSMRSPLLDRERPVGQARRTNIGISIV